MLFLKPGSSHKHVDRICLKSFLELGKTKVSDIHLCVLLFLIETLKIPQKVMRFEKPEVFRAESPMPRLDRLGSKITLEAPGSPLSFSPSSPAIDYTPGAEDLVKLVPPNFLKSFKPLSERFRPKEPSHCSRKSLSTFSRIVQNL